jgi:hypothetical protein
MEFMTFWIRDNLSEPCKGTYRMLYTKPSGEQFGMSPEIEVDLSNHERSRNKLIFRGMNVDQGGEYTFVIEVREDQNWREVTRVPLKINFIVREEQQSSNPAQ